MFTGHLYSRKKESEAAQSSPTLCSPMDCSLPGCSAHGISQARILEWIAISFSHLSHQGSPQSSAGEESTCNAGDLGSIPVLGRSPGEGKGYQLQYSGLDNSKDYSSWGCKESDMTKQHSLSFILKSSPNCLCIAIRIDFVMLHKHLPNPSSLQEGWFLIHTPCSPQVRPSYFTPGPKLMELPLFSSHNSDRCHSQWNTEVDEECTNS